MNTNRDIPALLDWIAAHRFQPHSWARGGDCVSFALGGVAAQTGVDHLAPLPGWSNRAEALAVARELGGLTAALDARLVPIAPALAQRGDVAGLADRAFGVRLMIVEGETLVGPGALRQERLPRSTMLRAWSALPAGEPADE
tara:strand:- start:5619 stop:6044 length:426 start_codon:yes stop_codon:yes gene_type:complete